MAGYVILGALAAFGLLSAVWVLLGWLLPRGSGTVLVCLGTPEEGIVSRYRWLRECGLVHSPLLIVTEESDPAWQNAPGIELCRPEALLSRLELERKEIDGTGNGDPTGHHQRGGVPEL